MLGHCTNRARYAPGHTRAQAYRDSIIGTGRARGIRTTDLPNIDSFNRITSERPDSYNDSTGSSTTGRAKLLDNMFDHWQDLAETLRIPWMGDQLLAIAAITAECLQQVNSIECDMSDNTGEESAGTGDVAAEAQHSVSDV